MNRKQADGIVVGKGWADDPGQAAGWTDDSDEPRQQQVKRQGGGER